MISNDQALDANTSRSPIEKKKDLTLLDHFSFSSCNIFWCDITASTFFSSCLARLQTVFKSLVRVKEEWYIWDEIILEGIVAIREMNGLRL